MQITALGNPKLLERVAAGLMAIRNMFSQFDEDMNNVITREEFIKVTSFWACMLLRLSIKNTVNQQHMEPVASMPRCLAMCHGTACGAVQAYQH